MAVPTLVVAVDLAHNSDHVVEQAVSLAQQLNARVTLVHAMALARGVRPDTVITVPGRESASAGDLLRADAEKHTRALMSKLEEASIPAELVLGYGDPCKLIGNTATEQGALMVLVGAPSAGPLHRLLGKDLCTAILECCTVPVLIVPKREAADGDAYSTAQFQMLAETDG